MKDEDKTFLFASRDASCVFVQLRVLSIIFYIAVRPFLDIEQSSALLYSSGDLHKANKVLLLIWLQTVFSG